MSKPTKKNLYDSLKEWSISVPKRWWEMLGVPLTFIPLLVGVILFLRWARNTTPPLSWWIISLVVGGAILFFIVSFLAFHRVKMERNEARESIKELTKEFQQKYDSILSVVRHNLAFDGPALITKVFSDCITVQVGARLRNACQELIEFKVTKFVVTVAGKTVQSPQIVPSSAFIHPLQTREYYSSIIKLEGKPDNFLGALEYEVRYSSIPNTQWYRSGRKMGLEFKWQGTNLTALYKMEQELEE